jgi:hypothetical protein
MLRRAGRVLRSFKGRWALRRLQRRDSQNGEGLSPGRGFGESAWWLERRVPWRKRFKIWVFDEVQVFKLSDAPQSPAGVSVKWKPVITPLDPFQKAYRVVVIDCVLVKIVSAVHPKALAPLRLGSLDVNERESEAAAIAVFVARMSAAGFKRHRGDYHVDALEFTKDRA